MNEVFSGFLIRLVQILYFEFNFEFNDLNLIFVTWTVRDFSCTRETFNQFQHEITQKMNTFTPSMRNRRVHQFHSADKKNSLWFVSLNQEIRIRNRDSPW